MYPEYTVGRWTTAECPAILGGVTRWLPELVRRRPSRDLGWRYRPRSAVLPGDIGRRLASALGAAGADADLEGRDPSNVVVRLPWMTLVFGVVPRMVREEVRIRVARDDRGVLLDVRCTPLASHEAHATGLALVLLVASAVWVIGGVTRGLVPAATTLVGFGLWTDLTRRSAMLVLDRRLARLTDDLGRAVWTDGVGRLEHLDS